MTKKRFRSGIQIGEMSRGVQGNETICRIVENIGHGSRRLLQLMACLIAFGQTANLPLRDREPDV